MKLFFTIVLCVISFTRIYSQPYIEWAARYAGNMFNHYAKDMAIDDEGNVYVTGTLVIDSVNNDFITLKFDKFGSLVWARTYDGPQSGEDEPAAIKIDNMGNIIVTGVSRNPGPYEALTIKYDTNGDTLWVKRYQNKDNRYYLVKGMEVDTNGGIYIFGEKSRENVSTNLLTLKYDPDGNLDWFREFGTPTTDLSRDIGMDKNDKITIYGSTGIGGVMIKYNQVGDSIWGRIFTPQAVRQILFDDFNNTYLGGAISTPKTSTDFYLAKIDTIGNILWERTYHSSSYNNVDSHKDIYIDKENNAYITGISAKTGELGWDYLTIKYNSNGDSLWVRRFNPVTISNDEPVSVVTDKNNNVFVTGKSDRATFWNKISTVVYSPSGEQMFVLLYDTNAPFRSHEPVKMLCDTSGSIYICGNSQNVNGKWDMVVLKYSPVVSSIQQISNEVPGSFELFQNYPNPFNSSTTIKYYILKQGQIKINVRDVLGREIETLVNSIHLPGEYKIMFDAKRYSSGIYFYDLSYNGDIIHRRKLVLVK